MLLISVKRIGGSKKAAGENNIIIDSMPVAFYIDKTRKIQ